MRESMSHSAWTVKTGRNLVQGEQIEEKGHPSESRAERVCHCPVTHVRRERKHLTTV